MRRLLALLAYVGVSITTLAQQSLFQSSDGTTSIYTQRPTATLNFGDSKASVAYSKHDNQQSVVWGYELFAKASSGVANLFNSDKPKAPEGGGDFTIGRHYDFKPGPPPPPPAVMIPGKRYEVVVTPEREKWWLVDVGYSRSSFYVSNTAVLASQASTNFDRYRVLGVWNLTWYGTELLGFAGGVERRNNLDGLKSVQFETVVAPAQTGASNSVVTTKTGYYGNYQAYTAAPVYGDWLHYLTRRDKSDKSEGCTRDRSVCKHKGIALPGFGNPIATDLFVRADLGNANRGAKGGLGVYLFKKDDSLTPVGGVTVSYDGSKVQAGVTTSFNLSK